MILQIYIQKNQINHTHARKQIISTHTHALTDIDYAKFRHKNFRFKNCLRELIGGISYKGERFANSSEKNHTRTHRYKNAYTHAPANIDYA